MNEVRKVQGRQFSEQDRHWWPEIDDDGLGLLPPYGAEAPLWLVIAVAPLQRVPFNAGAKSVGKRLNVWQFNVGELRFWPHAEVGHPDDTGIAQLDQDVVLDMFPPFYNVPGDRLR